MKKLREEVEKKGLKLSVTENGKEGTRTIVKRLGAKKKGEAKSATSRRIKLFRRAT